MLWSLERVIRAAVAHAPHGSSEPWKGEGFGCWKRKVILRIRVWQESGWEERKRCRTRRAESESGNTRKGEVHREPGRHSPDALTPLTPVTSYPVTPAAVLSRWDSQNLSLMPLWSLSIFLNLGH